MLVRRGMEKRKEIVDKGMSDEGYGVVGEGGEGVMFEDLKEKMVEGGVEGWVRGGGIRKKMRFECRGERLGRVEVEMGREMGVMEGYVGDKKIRRREMYWKIGGEEMCEVVEKIRLKGKEG